MEYIFCALFSEASDLFIMHYKSVSHESHNGCMKIDKNDPGINHKDAEDAYPGPSDFSKRVDDRSSRTESDAERPKYHLNNYIGFQDMGNKIFFSLQHFPKMIMNVTPGMNNQNETD